ncbi:MAG TPA: flagellar basal body P-ring protein FlgI, partial [Turneriella sp.]|nr:flagellar basal body P-ring protein FlgI [Turneriella sp.]
YLSKILAVKVDVPERTKVVLDTRTGTIVSGGSVAISAVMVTHNGMQIEVSGKKAYAYGDEKSPANAELKEGATVKELVDNLNKLGLTSAEIIDVIKAIHAAGALHGELTVL